jgi:ABC-type dipeptide/oligopeptide/nickel transport system permease subunit
MNFTAAVIAALIGTIMTLFFAYFPIVRVKFASLTLEIQALIKLGLMVVVALIMFGLSFTSIFPPPLTLPELFSVIIALIISNQPVAALLPQLPDVRAAIRLRTEKFMRG